MTEATEEGRFKIEDAKMVLPRQGSSALAVMKVSERIREVLQGFDLLSAMARGEEVEINEQKARLPPKGMSIPIVKAMHGFYMGYNNFGEEYNPTDPIRMPPSASVGRALDVFIEAENAEGVRWVRDRLEETLLDYREGLSLSPEFIMDVNLWAYPSPTNPGMIFIGVRIDRFRFIDDVIMQRSDALAEKYPPVEDAKKS